MTAWDPIAWYETSAPDRSRALVAWRRQTLEPKYGLPYGVEYTLTEGTTELAEFRAFFRPSIRTITPALASILNVRPGTPMVYYPRRGFDVWNTGYSSSPPIRGGPNRGGGSRRWLPIASRSRSTGDRTTTGRCSATV
jgi:hypothetical protein